MMISGGLSFGWSPWTLAASSVVVAAAAVICWLSWRRSGYRQSSGLLEWFRFALVVAMAGLLNQPEWVGYHQPQGRPTVALLWDASSSMDTRDVVDPNRKQDPPISRRQAIASATEVERWRTVDARLDVAARSFAAQDTLGTDISAPLVEVLRQYDRLRAVIMISDGDWNTGMPPAQAASLLRDADVPVLAVPVGSRTKLPDLRLGDLGVPTFGVAGKSVRIPLTIHSSLPSDVETEIVLKGSDGSRVARKVRIAADGDTTEILTWDPQSAGEVTLTLEIPPHRSESLLDNNRGSAPITIRRERLRVLVVESYPRWEYRYLRNALSRDPGIDVACLLLHPGLSKVGGGNRDYLQQFPQGVDELAKYDVVVLGDVGLGEGQLTAQQCDQLKGLVEHQASGLVWIPGWQGRHASLLQTPLADLYPVVLDPAQPEGRGSSLPQGFELTELGRRSLLTRLADDAEENQRVWDALPGFQWHAPVLRAKAGSQTLAVHQDGSNRHGRLPLLVTQTYGAGKVLFIGTDSAWRWRQGVEDRYHYRFWGQVVRWMAYQRKMAEGDTMRLYFTPEQPQVGQTIAFSANVMDTDGAPLSDGVVSARIEGPSGTAQTLRFVSGDDGWGSYAARFRAVEPGQHRVTLSCEQTGATLQTSVYVQGGAAEQVGQPARPEVLEEIAHVTRGQVLELGELEQTLRSLADLPIPRGAAYRRPLWSHPLVAIALVGMLATFWSLRKMMGLI